MSLTSSKKFSIDNILQKFDILFSVPTLRNVEILPKEKYGFYFEIFFRSDVTQFQNPVEYRKTVTPSTTLFNLISISLVNLKQLGNFCLECQCRRCGRTN